LRLVTFHLSHKIYDLASLAEIGNLAQSDKLDQGVADEGGFDRSGDDGKLGGIGCHLIEQLVLRAAAEDMDNRDLPVGNSHHLLQHLTIRQRQTFQYTAHYGSRRERQRLICPAAPVKDELRMIARSKENRIIGIENSCQRLRLYT
jgi:hypothetical protein